MTSSATSDEAADAAEASPSGFRFPRAARLRRARDIRRVRRRGHRISGPRIDVIWTASDAGRTRIGIVVPRYGHSAVQRNRVRRRLAEIARTVWMPTFLSLGVELDVLLKAKPSAYGASYVRLRDASSESLEKLCARCSQA